MRRVLSALAALSLLATPGLAQDPDYGQPSEYSEPVDTYSQDEVVDAVADFFGVTAEAAASVLERVFSDLGRPVGYVAGEARPPSESFFSRTCTWCPFFAK